MRDYTEEQAKHEYERKLETIERKYGIKLDNKLKVDTWNDSLRISRMNSTPTSGRQLLGGFIRNVMGN